MTDEIRALPAVDIDSSELSKQLLKTDASINVLSQVSTVTPVGPSVGQKLRAAREAKGLSASDVAHALKLSVHQVYALENDNCSSLPGTISRGFIRNYARLLNLDSEALMSQLGILHMPQPPELDLPGGASTALPRASRVERRDVLVMFSGLILVILALLAYFFVPQDFWQSRLIGLIPSTQESQPAAPVAEDAASLPPLPASDQAPPLGETVNVEQGASDQLSQSSAEAVPSVNQSASGASRLKLSFARSSWVEIRDRSGQVIFSQLNPGGSEREIEGLPPFALVIGSASGVTVQYNGKPVEIPQRSKDDVARLNLE